MEIEIRGNIANSYFKFDDLKHFFKSFMELSCWHGTVFKPILSAFENLMKEWNLWIFEKLPRAARANDWPHVLHCCIEIKSVIENILQMLENFETKWKLFHQEHSDLCNKSTFKTVAEKHKFMHDRVLENMINIMSLASYIRFPHSLFL